MRKEAGEARRSMAKKKPRFLKVFFPGLNSYKLEIPPAFRKHIQRVRPASTCFLTGPNSNVWRVVVIKNESGVFFHNGWAEFARDHALQTGEFLIFEYQGRSCFSVLIFDASMCEKVDVFTASSPSQRLAGSVEGREPQEKVKEEPYSSVSSENNFTAAPKRKGCLAGSCPPQGDTSRNAKRKVPKKHYRGVWLSQRRPVLEMEIKKAHQAACLFKSVNPFLVHVMQKYDVYIGHQLRVPITFSRQHLLAKQRMTFWDPMGKPWTVNYISCSTRCFFSSGWCKFALGNFLEQGDVCVFELIKVNEIRVHIFRVVKEIRPLMRKVGF